MTTEEFVLTNALLRCVFRKDAAGAFRFVTQHDYAGEWTSASQYGTSPLEAVSFTDINATSQSVTLSNAFWRAEISPLAEGFQITATVTAAQPFALNPSMILWLGGLDGLDDRQAHTWRQTVLRAPTVNQQGLTGNDLPAGYVYDHANHLETICYFPADSFTWTPHRFAELSVREVTTYRPTARYGFGLVPNNAGETMMVEAGTHHFRWWFTQHRRETPPSPWEAQTALLDAIAPLLDPLPRRTPDALDWQQMAERTLTDLENETCWITAGDQRGLRAYVKGSSSVGRDNQTGFELMTQLDVAWPLLLWSQALPADHPSRSAAQRVFAQLRATLTAMHRPEHHFVANHYPIRVDDTFMDTWYFLENALIKLPWVAYLSDDQELRDIFFDALHGATLLAHNVNYVFPLFADAQDWRPRGSLLNVSVGGLYAAGHVLAYQMTGHDSHLEEARLALRTMWQLPPHQLTHEPQQLTFAAAAARYLCKRYPAEDSWKTMSQDFTRLMLRMGYWSADSGVSFYDTRGMFQACASLCYPAYKENVECLLSWPELLQTPRPDHRLVPLMASFANLQRCHNYAFFDPHLPADLRRGPCAYIPYEDVATTEFRHTADLGKELYGAGEVFWSALLFDTLGHADDPDVLCLSLDVPCLELGMLPAKDKRHQFLLYNPTAETREVRISAEYNPFFQHSFASFTLQPRSLQFVGTMKGEINLVQS
ncbi:MAG: hypothetical protein KF716_28035 [Anaerolineae bacterium]|nr:hypothetical protein [Anaerolineae bacterium]